MVTDIEKVVLAMSANDSMHFTIDGNGTRMKSSSSPETAADVHEQLRLFYESLAPGKYTITHRKSEKDTSGSLTVAIHKSPFKDAGDYVGAPQHTDLYLDARDEVQRLKYEIESLKREHDFEKRMLAMEQKIAQAKETKEIDPMAAMDKFNNLIAGIGNVMALSNGKAVAKVAVAGTGKKNGQGNEDNAEAASVSQEDLASVNKSLETIAEEMGPEFTVKGLEKLANLAKTNPGMLKSLL